MSNTIDTASLPALPPDIANAPLHVQERYLDMIENGQSPRLAEMLALRSAPALKGDGTHWLFNRPGVRDPLENVPVQFRERYRRLASQAGVNIDGRKYVGGLARFPGDPRAWVDDISTAKRIVESEGSGSDYLGIKAREVCDIGPSKDYRVADDIVAEHAADALAEHGHVTEREWNDQLEKSREACSPAPLEASADDVF